jgi:hypothetical protein
VWEYLALFLLVFSFLFSSFLFSPQRLLMPFNIFHICNVSPFFRPYLLSIPITHRTAVAALRTEAACGAPLRVEAAGLRELEVFPGNDILITFCFSVVCMVVVRHFELRQLGYESLKFFQVMGYWSSPVLPFFLTAILPFLLPYFSLLFSLFLFLLRILLLLLLVPFSFLNITN